jgi:hypothetical protein
MKIKQSDIIADRLPEIRTVNGYTNRYIPKWQICNTEYYNENPDEFQGWIELEDNFPTKE